MSWLLLVSGSRKRVNKDRGVSADDRKSSGSVLLSTAAKLRVVAERDLCEKEMQRCEACYGEEKKDYTVSALMYFGFNFQQKRIDSCCQTNEHPPLHNKPQQACLILK